MTSQLCSHLEHCLLFSIPSYGLIIPPYPLEVLSKVETTAVFPLIEYMCSF